MAQIAVAVLELDTVIRFIRSCAMTHALAESAKLEWKTYDDSTFLNIAYGLLPWKEKPGSVEVQIATGRKLNERFESLSLSWMDTWLLRGSQSPAMMVDHLNRLEKIRTSDRETLDFIFREAQAINNEVTQQLNTTIRTFAAIKLGSTIAIALMSGGAAIAIAGGASAVTLGGATLAFGGSGTAIGAVSAGYGLTCTVIKEWGAVPSAKALAISKDVSKTAAGEAIDKTADHMLKKAAASQTLQQKLLDKATRQINHYSKMVAESGRQRVRNRAAQKLAQKQIQQQTAQKGLRQAGNMATAGKALKYGAPIIFAAVDIWDGISDFREVWDQTK
jgi:uncharacterized Zn-binding protein involved in type VI secretion